jgi:hypothetical protein
MRQIACAFAIALLLLGVLGPESAHAGLSFNVSVDTSSLSGQSGFLDFQFNPGDSSALPATAAVTHFQTIGGILAQPASLTGDATGSLPGTLTLDNGTVYNDVFQGFTFGNSFGFNLTLSGPAIDTPSGTVGSAFAVSLYAADGITPLLTTDPNGSVSTVYLNANGTASAEVFPQSPTDNTAAASVTALTAVPEPSTLTMVLLLSSLQAALILLRSARRRRSAGNITH